jgi:hypothetical protein
VTDRARREEESIHTNLTQGVARRGFVSSSRQYEEKKVFDHGPESLEKKGFKRSVLSAVEVAVGTQLRRAV